jgi:hypothetical protein
VVGILVLKAFSLTFLVGGSRFAHGRRLQDDEAVAEIIERRAVSTVFSGV